MVKVLSGEWYFQYMKNTSLKKHANISSTKGDSNEYPLISGSAQDKHSVHASLIVVGDEEELFLGIKLKHY